MRPSFFYFDLGNVLYTFDYERSAAKAAQLIGVDSHRLRSALYDFGLEEMYETGGISSSRLVAELERSLGIELDGPSFLQAVSDMFTFCPPIVPVIERLRRHDVPIGILSNTCPAHWEWIAGQGDIDASLFREVILSYEVGCMKPHAAIYAAAEAAAGVPPEEIWFIDDRAINVRAAQQRGWRTILYIEAAEVLEALEAAGLS